MKVIDVFKQTIDNAFDKARANNCAYVFVGFDNTNEEHIIRIANVSVTQLEEAVVGLLGELEKIKMIDKNVNLN